MVSNRALPEGLLAALICRQAPQSASWFEETGEALRRAPTERALAIAIGLAPRKLGKGELLLTEEDLAEADRARPGWQLRGWSIDQAARICFLLAAAADDGFPGFLERLFLTAEVSEQVAYYRGLPLYPHPDVLVARAAEGLRSNMKVVFEAVAHHNPFPAENFLENTWNHMVLKALFIGSALAPIHGLDRRANPELARMLLDYAHERWAARRPINPELWRCIGPFADDHAVVDLARLLESEDRAERRAAALALSACPQRDAADLLRAKPEILADIGENGISWERLA